MNEFIKVIFGEFTAVQLLGYLWFFVIGYIIYGLSEATGRDVKSARTPVKWSWKFWFYDNWRRYVTTLLSTYILFRFYTEVSGHPFGYFDAVALGLIGDGIAATLKERVSAIAGNENVLKTVVIQQDAALKVEDAAIQEEKADLNQQNPQ